jgi:hypothetical protein
MSQAERLDPNLFPFASPEERKLLRERVLASEDDEALVAEIHKRCEDWRANLPKPTREQLLQVTHAENQMHATSGHANQAFWDALEADWRRKQKPDSPQWNLPQSKPEPSQRSKQQPYEPPVEHLHPMEKEHQRSKREQVKKELQDLGISRDLFGDAIRANRERRHLQKREELLEREEVLQRQRELGEVHKLRGASLWPGAEEQHARRMQASFENKSDETLPRSHRISRVLAGGLFALFFGAFIQALTLFGVITLNSGHIFMVIAFMAGVLMITTEILPLKPTRHKVGAIVILGVVLGLIDLAAALYAQKRDAPAPQNSTIPLATVNFIDQGFGDTKFPFRAGQLLGVNFVYKQHGGPVARNVHFYYAIGFVRRDVSLEQQSKEIDDLFGQIYQAADINSRSRQKGIDVFAGKAANAFFSAILPSLTSDDLRGFERKEKALAAMARIEYDDNQWTERCVMFISESVAELTKEGNIIWQYCPLHNTASIR